mgnify:CR=1 FL=1
MPTPITDIEIRKLLTPGDVLDAQDAGIIPDGNYTLRNEEVILQNREIYKWLKSKDDPRFIDTILQNETTSEELIGSNLYTSGSEFINRRTGEEYIGFYHIHPDKGPMVGAFHVSEKHDFLDKISNMSFQEAEVINIFESTLVDKNTFEPIVNATIDDGKGNQTKTDKNGNFKIEIPLNKINPKPAKLIISSPNYSQETITPVTQDGNVRDTLGIIPLTTTKEQIQEEERKEILLPEPQIKSLQALKTDFETKKQIAINNLIIRLKTVLLPQILNMIAIFGISKIQEALGKKFGDLNATCPANIDELNRLIAKKNKLTKALNNLYNFLETIEVGVKILDKTITAADIALTTAQALTFVPSTALSPIPSASSNVVEKIRRELKKYKIISSSTLLVLEILTEILFKIIQYLKLLDSLIEGCTQELPDSQESSEQIQQQISNDLLKATEEQSKQLSPVITNVNGFEMGVISENGETNFSLKRRQAIAKNKEGVIMLRGELSFSSNDQILIDELVFYIKQNNLKAGLAGTSSTQQQTTQQQLPQSSPVSSGGNISGGSGGGGGGGY